MDGCGCPECAQMGVDDFVLPVDNIDGYASGYELAPNPDEELHSDMIADPDFIASIVTQVMQQLQGEDDLEEQAILNLHGHGGGNNHTYVNPGPVLKDPCGDVVDTLGGYSVNPGDFIPIGTLGHNTGLRRESKDPLKRGIQKEVAKLFQERACREHIRENIKQLFEQDDFDTSISKSFDKVSEKENELMDIMLKYIKDPDDAQEKTEDYLYGNGSNDFTPFDIRVLGNIPGDFEKEIENYAYRWGPTKYMIDGKEVDIATIELDGTGPYDTGRMGIDDALPDIFASAGHFTDGTELTDDQLYKFTDEYPELIHDITTGIHEGSCGYTEMAPGGQELSTPGDTQGMGAYARTNKMKSKMEGLHDKSKVQTSGRASGYRPNPRSRQSRYNMNQQATQI